MKLLVCFKVIPDLDQMQPPDFMAGKDMEVDASFVRTIWNCFDECGLEFGLRLSDEAESLNLHCDKTAFTISGGQAEPYLKTLYALKYDHVVCIDDQGWDTRFQPKEMAAEIVKYASKTKPDYIIMGRQAAPGSNGLTPQFAAKGLQIPLIPNVIDMHLKEDGNLSVITEEPAGFYEQNIAGPAVLTIGNAVISKLRVPTLKDRLKYGNQEVERTSAEWRSFKEEQMPCAMSYINRERGGKILRGEKAIGKLLQIYSDIKEGEAKI